MSLLDSSGGLLYHARALRWRHSLWQPFGGIVRNWLRGWQPPAAELVIIGPSAGYTLDAAFLAGFRRIVILEPDPLARALFRRRFAGLAVSSVRLDCFAGVHGPAMLRNAFPHAAFLFSNVLGQLIARLDPDWPAALLGAMHGARWASYHDVVACTEPPAQRGPRQADTGEQLETLLAAFWPPAGKGPRTLELYDHGSFGRLPASAHAVWSLTPRQHHLIGWTADGASCSSWPPITGIGGRS